jgi:integrase
MATHDTHLSPIPVTPKGGTYLSTLPSHAADAVAALRAASKSANTVRAYQADWSRWAAWCADKGHSPLPATPEQVAWYLADQVQQVKVSTLARHLATISKAHQVAGVPSPTRDTLVRDTLAGLRRVHGQRPKEAAGLLAADMRTTLDTLGGDLSGLRDRALLLVGWCAALRRSEIAGLCWGDIEQDPEGVRLLLRHTKTDHTGQGEQVGLAREQDLGVCPVAALERWRDAVAHERSDAVAADRPVFLSVSRHGQLGVDRLSGQAVGEIITRRCDQAGLAVRYQGHSLRKGLVQQATLAGVADSAVMATTRHKTVTMLRRYQGQVALVSNAAARGLLGGKVNQ